MKSFYKTFLIVMVTVLFTVTILNTNAFAKDPGEPPAMEAMAADLLLLKPLGFVATTIGCVLFVAALPFTVWSEERISNAGQRFVIEPGTYTFVRPLGQFDDK